MAETAESRSINDLKKQITEQNAKRDAQLERIANSNTRFAERAQKLIDADKENYKNYYNLSIDLVKTNGFILIDNVLWHGDVADPSKNDRLTKIIREFNQSDFFYVSKSNKKYFVTQVHFKNLSLIQEKNLIKTRIF